MGRTRTGALALMLLATGCGEGEPLTRTEYAARADAVCRDVAASWRELEPPVAEDPVDEQEFAEMMAWEMAAARDLTGEVLGRVDDLTPPASLEEKTDALWETLRRIADDLDAYAAALETRNEAELERLSEEVDDTDQESFQRRAKALGLKDCGKGLFLSPWRPATAPAASQEPLDFD